MIQYWEVFLICFAASRESWERAVFGIAAVLAFIVATGT